MKGFSPVGGIQGHNLTQSHTISNNLTQSQTISRSSPVGGIQGHNLSPASHHKWFWTSSHLRREKNQSKHSFYLETKDVDDNLIARQYLDWDILVISGKKDGHPLHIVILWQNDSKHFKISPSQQNSDTTTPPAKIWLGQEILAPRNPKSSWHPRGLACPLAAW